ncbi:MAG: helix-turn-helix domain-containing protein [Hasllibacter sp.]
MNTQVRIPLPDAAPSRSAPRVTARKLRLPDPWQDEVIRARPSGTAVIPFRDGVRAYVEGLPVVIAPGSVLWVPAGVPFGLDMRGARGRVVEVEGRCGLPNRPVLGRTGDGMFADPLPALRAALSGAEDLPRPTASQRLVRGFVLQLERSLDAAQRVQDHADRLGVTATHLSRVCRATTGHTAVRLCTRRTVAEARRLLAETGRPVGEIGAALGYASASYFTRDFQLRCGITPSGFRAAVRRGDASVMTSPDVANGSGEDAPSG